MGEPRRRVDGLIQTLVEARHAQRLSVEELAHRAGLDRASIQRWEKGTYEPKLPYLRRWAAELGLTLIASANPRAQDLSGWHRGYERGRSDATIEMHRALDKISGKDEPA